jgi:hypothetical protein
LADLSTQIQQGRTERASGAWLDRLRDLVQSSSVVLPRKGDGNEVDDQMVVDLCHDLPVRLPAVSSKDTGAPGVPLKQDRALGARPLSVEAVNP